MSAEHIRLATDAGNDERHRAALVWIREDIAEAETEVLALEARLASARKTLAATRAVERSIARLLGEDPAPACRPEPRPGTHAEAIEKILAAAGRPLRVRELCRLLESCGHPLPAGASREATVCSAMTRHPDVFRRIVWGVWGLAAWGEHPWRQAVVSDEVKA